MNILIIDEHEVVRRQLFWALRREHEVHEAEDREQARNILARITPDVILFQARQDHSLNGNEATAGLAELSKMAGQATLLAVFSEGEDHLAAQLLEAGAWDVLQKPVNGDELEVILRRIHKTRQLRLLLSEEESPPEQTARKEGRRASDWAASLGTGQGWGIIGVDQRVKHILEQIKRIAPTPVSVMITGETGTGKEVFAKALHNMSERVERPFVALNCAVLSDNLVEDELFGHEKGAYTGAIDRRQGKFEVANRGTLFLDEIGEISLSLQGKFLRVLQEKTFERLGGNQQISTDFRLISATNQDLPQLASQGRFREDLMYRVNVVEFHLPPLRERREDIKLLAQHFLDRFCAAFGRKELTLSREVQAYLMDYPWPGNVRELEHFIERSVALADGPVIGREALPDSFQPSLPNAGVGEKPGQFSGLIRQYKKQLVAEALALNGNNKIKTAHLLGISKSYLFKLIKQLAIKP